jgi:hypothetical protein
LWSATLERAADRDRRQEENADGERAAPERGFSRPATGGERWPKGNGR